MSHNFKFLALLVSLTLVRGLIYIAIFPPWLAPDEPAHFEAIRLMGQEGVWPTQAIYLTTPMHPDMHTSFQSFQIWQLSGYAPPQDALNPHEPVNNLFIYYYPPTSTGSLIIAGNYPLVYHVLMAPLSALVKNFPLVQQLYLMRLVSLLFTTLTVILGWFFAQTIFPGNKVYAFGLTIFLIFLPMNLHVNTSVNSDVFVVFLVSLYFFGLAKLFCEGVSLSKIGLTAVALGLAIMTKPTALFIIPTTFVALIVYLARRFYWKPLLLTGLLVIIVVLTFSGSIVLFQVTEGGRAISTLQSFSQPLNLQKNYFGPSSWAIYLHTIRWGFLSFWGLFGWANIPILRTGMRAVWLICLVIGFGGLLFIKKYILPMGQSQRPLSSNQQDILLVLLFSLIFILISMYTPIIATQSTHWGPPSRYFFPALLPFSLYFFLGYQQLIPARFYSLTLPIWLAALLLFDTFAWGYVLIPRLYG
ncbi:MAG TPA: DUF2142 domain-containing protein [Anaerolineae bacterium]|nr:DUF2142 domain-containing protein [Anaerolineae bacterium]